MTPAIQWLNVAVAETFTLPSGRVMAPLRREGEITFPADRQAQAIALLGTVNCESVRFANFIALPETLLATAAGPDQQGRHGLHVLWMATRGLCEDGVTRFVGWNRVYRPQTDRWERCGPLAKIAASDGRTVAEPGGPLQWGSSLYAYAEDALAGGLAHLWT